MIENKIIIIYSVNSKKVTQIIIKIEFWTDVLTMRWLFLLVVALPLDNEKCQAGCGCKKGVFLQF